MTETLDEAIKRLDVRKPELQNMRTDLKIWDGLREYRRQKIWAGAGIPMLGGIAAGMWVGMRYSLNHYPHTGTLEKVMSYGISGLFIVSAVVTIANCALVLAESKKEYISNYLRSNAPGIL